MSPETEKLILGGLESLGISFEEGDVRRLSLFMDELLLWNRVHNLFRGDEKSVVSKHFLDSLAPLPLLKREFSPFLDIGSGAGFPAIPLALFLPNTEILLCEKKEKRAAFLKNSVALLKLTNCSVLNCDFKIIAKQFGAIIFRAFQPLSVALIDSLMPLLQKGGSIWAYKGKRENIERELEAFAEKMTALFEIIPLTVPFLDEERHLIKIRSAE